MLGGHSSIESDIGLNRFFVEFELVARGHGFWGDVFMVAKLGLAADTGIGRIGGGVGARIFAIGRKGRGVDRRFGRRLGDRIGLQHLSDRDRCLARWQNRPVVAGGCDGL